MTRRASPGYAAAMVGRQARGVAVLAGLLVGGCGDAAGPGADEVGESEVSGSDSESSSGTSAGSETDTSATTETETETRGTETSATTETETTEDDSESEDTGTKFDMGAPPDAPPPDCYAEPLDVPSYIWIANTTDSTLSKINTETLEEEARYLTREDGMGNPSRTSVNLVGDVVVANRRGGITKVTARTDNCDPERNGVPGLQTSTGKDDVLPWGEDDCVAWHAPIPHIANRPVAWDFGELDTETCEVTNSRVWTAGSDGVGANAHLYILDGETGEQLVDQHLLYFSHGSLGPYGAAFDPDQNFWMISMGFGATLARIDGESLAFDSWVAPSNVVAYGFTVDSYGRPWIADSGGDGVTLVFDPETETFLSVPEPGFGFGMGESSDGRMWQAASPPNAGLRAYDLDTLELVAEVPLPLFQSRGVGVDRDGYVWLVEVGPRAFRVDPGDASYQVYDGLDEAYTYSDLTGAALQLAAGYVAG